MDAFLLVAIVLVLGLAVAPMFLMRGQYGKAKPKPGADGAEGGILRRRDVWTGGKGKGSDNDSGSDGGGGDGGGD